MKNLFLSVAVLGLFLSGSSAVQAGPVSYDFGGLAFYQFGDPVDLVSGSVYNASPDTGFVRITNNGSSTFTGTIGFTAMSAFFGDLSSAYPVTLNPGDSMSFALSSESSNDGGFGGLFGGPQTGATFFMNGTVTLGAMSSSVSLSILDRDIHSGVPRTNPFGETLDNYILQGGTSVGFDTGDGYEVTQAPGAFQFASAVPEPATMTLAGLGMLGVFGYRRLRGVRQAV